ncbi:unnamed protein product [Rhizoctonia solani]|uniref:Uncharacterized protein n=1 Tax=Rhizoctonia solani TaxID=456999 RepID=A0A8H3HIN9_9AGAM|nr:unnamed protein product [Rhizoctonia solani]
MSCYINIAPADLFEAKYVTPLGKSTRSRSFNGLVSWLLTTTITVLGSNHNESSRSTEESPSYSSSDLVLAVSSPLAYQLLPTWLRSPRGAICIQEL